MTKLATLIAKMEGYGKPGAIPTVRNNPGDLRHSPHSEHPGGPAHKDDIGTIDTPEHGWEDLDFEITLILKEHPRLTLHDFVAGQRVQDGTIVPGGYPGWAPAGDGSNQPMIYSRYLATGLGLSISDPLAIAVTIPA